LLKNSAKNFPDFTNFYLIFRKFCKVWRCDRTPYTPISYDYAALTSRLYAWRSPLCFIWCWWW